MKKLIVGFLSFVLLFAGQSAFAANIWNTASNDCPSINIANWTTQTGFGDPCWTGTNINANPGETINVRIYYHNTSNATATNTYIKLNAPSGSSTNQSFTAQILSPQGNLSSGSVSVNIPTSQTLTFGSTRWYPNQTQTSTSFLNGQNGSEVIGSSGLYIGNIAPGWATQGSVVVSFHVSNSTPPANCSINSFTANPTQIIFGASSTLSWNTSNCTSANISPNVGTVPVNGNQTVYPTQNTTTYTLTATGSNGGQQTRTVTVTAVPPPLNCSINSFTANPTTITFGQSSTLNWSTTNCTSVTISNLGYNVPTTGSQAVYPTQTTTYTLTAVGSNGSVQTRTVTVTVPPLNCSINSFTANPQTITSGQSSTLNWSTSNCASIVITPGVGNVSLNGYQSVSPTITTTYTIKAYNGAGALADTDNVTVTVNPIPSNCSINSFTANPTTITPGQSSTLSWNTINCTSVKLDGAEVQASSSKTVYPAQTTTYRLTAVGSNGIVQNRSVIVTVNPIPSNCSINSFTANPTTITSGQSSTLNWSTTNCASVTISNLGYNVPTTGSQAVYPTQTTTYTLRAYGSNGSVQTRTVTVTVNPIISTCSINNFTANPQSINSGGSSTLNWDTSNCNSVSLDGAEVQISSSKTVYPTQTTTYTLRAYGSSGVTQTRTTTVIVNNNNTDSCIINSFYADPSNITSNESSILYWRTENCNSVTLDGAEVQTSGQKTVSPNNTQTYTLRASGSLSSGNTKTSQATVYVDDNNNNSECSIDSYTASDTDIEEGDRVNLKWRTSNCDDISISNLDDNLPEDGNDDVYPRKTTTYTLRASGNGSESRSIRIEVDSNNDPIIYNTNVVTTIATNVSQTGAQLNGLMTNLSCNNASIYFEYGTNINLGMRTASRMISGTYFSEYVTNLNPNTIYFFRAVVEGSNCSSQGAIEIFQTLRYNTNTNTNTNNVQTIRQVVYQGTTVSGSESPIMLRIENRYPTIGIGDIIDYVVYYKNISSSTLTHPMVQVFIPKGITLLNSSRGTYSESDKTLSVPIEDLIPNAEGVIYIQARVDSMDSNLAQIVTTTVLVYTNPNGAQENAMAYVLNNPRIGSLLGASAYFGNIFGLGLIGWLLLLILILLLVLIARSLYARRNVVTTTTQKTISQ